MIQYGAAPGYTRVDKAKAGRLFAAGKTIEIQSCKYRHINPFQGPFCVNIADNRDRYCVETDARIPYTLAEIAQEFAWYNCDWERGYYPAFYVKTTDLA